MARKGEVKFDDDFGYLLKIDPAFEEWALLAAEWLSEQKITKSEKKTALAKFFVEYLQAMNLEKHPLALLDKNATVSPLSDALNFEELSPTAAKKFNDRICDFIDWVLKEKFSVKDGSGGNVASSSLKNPFLRMQSRMSGKTSDVEFHYIVDIDPRMSIWQGLASEWLNGRRSNIGGRRQALDIFFVHHVIKFDLERNPYNFLRRDYSKPDFLDSILKRSNREISSANKTSKKARTNDIKFNNSIHDFIAWILLEKLSAEDDEGRALLPHEFHNPVPRLKQSGMGAAETMKSPLPYRYIRELRKNLAQGPNFWDWKWAHHAINTTSGGGDWFRVEPDLINQDDLDCVWRSRTSSKYERNTLGYPAEVFEMWSPVRVVALYLKLELPLRTFQVRMLDSGEADTWRYESGKWCLNDSPLATGSEKRPSQRGVFHRSSNEVGAGFYINTNKTADINTDENAKGYVIPWTYEPVLYWLGKLRNWQEKYNAIGFPTRWKDLELKHFGGTPPHISVLEERGASCFLFRDAAGVGPDRSKPINSHSIDGLWYALLADLEKRCEDKRETLGDGSPIRFIDPKKESATYYPLHALRVSLITAFALEGGVPFPVLSKLIVGHSRIIMTLYYTKAGKAHVTEVMQEAEKRIIENESASYSRFLLEKSYKEISELFAFNSPDALKAVSQQSSSASLIFNDKGICPVGGALCDVGGDVVREGKTDPRKSVYSPVAGYPQERNCVRCRFFLTGPAFLPGLQAHFNWLSYKATECAERYVGFEQQVKALEDARLVCEEHGTLFTQHNDLDRISRCYEEEAEKANKILTDIQAVVRLIDRCVILANENNKDGLQLVAAGDISDVNYALCETESEMYQLQVVCEDAVIFLDIDAGKATLRRSQILDAMLQMNGRSPIFFRLNPEQQLHVGNQVMKMIEKRVGGIKDAVEFAECKRMLNDVGILDEAISLIEEKTAGIAFGQVINASQSGALITDKMSVREDDNES